MAKEIILHTKPLPYAIFTVAIFPIATLFLVEGIHRGDIGLIELALILYGGLLLWCSYLASFKVILTEDILEVRNLYIWHKVPLSDIEKTYIQTSMDTWLGKKMTFRIWVEPRKDSGYKPFFIPIVNYKPEELRKLYAAIGVKSKRTRLFSREKISE